MNSDLLIIASIIIVGFALVIYFVRKQNSSPDSSLIEWLKTMQASFDQNTRTMNFALLSNSKQLNERLDNAARVIAQVSKNIGEMSEIGRSMRELQEFLRSPKMRGNIGEQVLKELLSQLLPKQSFHLQYAFKNGSIVDAAIKTEAGIIPIDSKFPMENFRKMNSSKNETEKKRPNGNSFPMSKNILTILLRNISYRLKEQSITHSCIFPPNLFIMKL